MKTKKLFALLLAAAMTVSISPLAMADDLTLEEEIIVANDPAESEEVVADTDSVIVDDAAEEAVEADANDTEEITLTEDTTALQEAVVSIMSATSGSCGDNVKWKYSNGTLTISGTGAMESSDGWSDFKNQIKKVEIGNGVTVIDSSAFSNCISLENVTIGNAVVEIGDNAFYNCQSLKSVSFPSTVKIIGDRAFRGCISLQSVTIPDNVTSMGTYVFYGCDSLQSATIGSGLTALPDRTFEDCISLSNVSIGSNVRSIGSSAFDNCLSLNKIVIPKSVKKIAIWAFSDTGLTDVYYEGTEAQWDLISISSYNNSLNNAEKHYAHSHSYTSKTTKATPSKDGSILKTCSGCGHTVSQTIYRPSTVSLSKTSYPYDGTVKKPNVTVKNSNGSTIASSNYTVSYASGRKNVGSYKVTVTFKGSTYSGSMSKTFTIAAKSVSGMNATLSKKSYTYSGSAYKPRVTLKNGSKTLKNGTDYSVSYSGNKNVGTAKVKITGKGNYSGTKTVKFKINPKGTTLKSVSAVSKGFTAKWTKQTTQTTGYQIQYATNSKFSGAKIYTVKSKKTTSQKISKLTAKKKYYVRIRTYKTVSGTKYCSGWSKTKTVTTKK